MCSSPNAKKANTELQSVKAERKKDEDKIQELKDKLKKLGG